MNNFNPISRQSSQTNDVFLNQLHQNSLQNGPILLADTIEGVFQRNLLMQGQLSAIPSFDPLNPMNVQFLYPNPLVFPPPLNFVNVSPLQFSYLPFSPLQFAHVGLDRTNPNPTVHIFPPQAPINSLIHSSNLGPRDSQSPAVVNSAIQPSPWDQASTGRSIHSSNLGPRDSQSPAVVNSAIQPSPWDQASTGRSIHSSNLGPRDSQSPAVLNPAAQPLAHNGAPANHSSHSSNFGPRDSQSPAAVSLSAKSPSSNSNNPSFSQPGSFQDRYLIPSGSKLASVPINRGGSVRKIKLPTEIQTIILEEREKQKKLLEDFQLSNPTLPFPKFIYISERDLRYRLEKVYLPPSLLDKYQKSLEISSENREILEEYVQVSAKSYDEFKEKILHFHAGNSSCVDAIKRKKSAGVVAKTRKKCSIDATERTKLDEWKEKLRDAVEPLFEKWLKENEDEIQKIGLFDLKLYPSIQSNARCFRIYLKGYDKGLFFKTHILGKFMKEILKGRSEDLFLTWEELLKEVKEKRDKLQIQCHLDFKSAVKSTREKDS